MPSTAANQLASIDRNLPTLRDGPSPRETARRIPGLLDDRDWLLGAGPRTYIVGGDRCRLRDALGQGKPRGKP